MKKNNPIILNGTILKYIYIYLQGSKGDIDIENTYAHSRGRRGQEGLREQHRNTCTTIGKIHSQWAAVGCGEPKLGAP